MTLSSCSSKNNSAVSMTRRDGVKEKDRILLDIPVDTPKGASLGSVVVASFFTIVVSTASHALFRTRGFGASAKMLVLSNVIGGITGWFFGSCWNTFSNGNFWAFSTDWLAWFGVGSGIVVSNVYFVVNRLYSNNEYPYENGLFKAEEWASGAEVAEERAKVAKRGMFSKFYNKNFNKRPIKEGANWEFCPLNKEKGKDSGDGDGENPEGYEDGGDNTVYKEKEGR